MNYLDSDNYKQRCRIPRSLSRLISKVKKDQAGCPYIDLNNKRCPYLFMIYNRNGGVQRDRPLAEELGVSPRFY